MGRVPVALTLLAALCLPFATAADERPAATMAAAAALRAAVDDDKRAPAAAQPKAGAPGAKPIEYVPPMLGSPAKRIAGGTRSIAPVVLNVLAPDHVALTASDQPALYWYVSAPTAIRVELVRVDASGNQTPLLEASYPKVEPGIHRFSLRDSHVRLTPDARYQWSVTSTLVENQRSREVVSRAVLQLGEAPGNPRASAAARSKAEQAVAFAAEGFWHDALDALSEAISAAPERRELREMRAELLEQAGLRAAAEFDRRTIRR